MAEMDRMKTCIIAICGQIVESKFLSLLDNLSEPDDLAQEIIEKQEAGLNNFREVLAGLQKTD